MNSLNHSPSDRELLPHLYGRNWYDWAWDIFTSLNHSIHLTAANQVSKSSTMIRRCNLFATAPEIWKELWPDQEKPTQFWYFYPSKDVATAEFDEKWVKEWLPRGRMKDHPVFGWKEERGQYRKIHALRFNSGVTVYFHSYEQRDTVLQAGSVYAMFCDEELPVEIYDEVKQRISAVGGYFHHAFTATLGQRFWYDTMEVKGKDERFKGALKHQVSKWDCLKYMDGTPSPWTPERIRKEENECSSESERLKRIEGRFVLGSARLFPSFRNRGNKIKTSAIPDGKALYFGAVYVSDDTGLAGIVILKAKEDLSEGDIISAYQFTDQSVSGLEIYLKFQELAKELEFAACFCNDKGKDFITISRATEPHFDQFKKPDDNAEKLINSLFGARILRIAAGRQNKELQYQITMTRKDDQHLKGKELLAAMVLLSVNIPWNFRPMLGLIRPKKKKPEMSERMKFWKGLDRPELGSRDPSDREFEEINGDIEGSVQAENFDEYI